MAPETGEAHAMIGASNKLELPTQNLDVPETSQDREIGAEQVPEGHASRRAPLYCLCAAPAQPIKRQQYRPAGTKHITLQQAANVIDAVGYASEIGLPLVAHLTIHWFGTDAGDDPDGKLFARVRKELTNGSFAGASASPGAGHESGERAVKQRSSIATCCSTYRWSTAQVRGCFRSRRLSIVSSSAMVSTSGASLPSI